MDRRGVGGMKLSTIDPYTVLQRLVVKSVTQLFVQELSDIPQVKPVEPSGVCFDSKSNKSNEVGPRVPKIELALHDKHLLWKIFGVNSMVEAASGVSCLAFVDGGLKKTQGSIVIGAYQTENNLVQFDLARSSLGFSSPWYLSGLLAIISTSLLFYKRL